MELTQKQKDLIKETIDIYIDPSKRSVNENNFCVYNGPDGKECAFARLLKPHIREGIPEMSIGRLVGDKILDLNNPDIYVEYAYYGFDIDFYIILQRIHDYILSPKYLPTVLDSKDPYAEVYSIPHYKLFTESLENYYNGESRQALTFILACITEVSNNRLP